MQKVYVLLFLCAAFTTQAQNPFRGWPNSGVELVKKRELPVIGIIKNKEVFYFNLNEDEWDSVYSYKNGKMKVKMQADGGYQRYFFSRHGKKQDYIDFVTPNHIKYKKIAVNSRDSIHRTYYVNGSLKDRTIISTQGTGTYYASESRDRYWDEFRYTNGMYHLDFVKDSVINGHKIVISGKVKNGDTTAFEIIENNGHIWKYRSEGQQVDFWIYESGDTLFEDIRPTSKRRKWWGVNAVLDSVWYKHGAIGATQTYRNGWKEYHAINAEGKSLITYFKPGIWGEEKERINHRVQPPECLDYSYFENDSTYWNYVIRGDTNYRVEKIIRTPTGKNKRMWIWENGTMQTFALDSNRNYLNDCGTNSSTTSYKVPKGFKVVLDSVVTENGRLKDPDLSELLILGKTGWRNWFFTQGELKKAVLPFLDRKKPHTSFEWVRNGSQLCPFSEQEWDWMIYGSAFSFRGIDYQSVEWNGKPGEVYEKVGVYFHINNLDLKD